MAKTRNAMSANRSHSAAKTAPLLVRAGILIGKRLDAFLSYEPFLVYPDKVYELHEMRIAAKRLRYTMEIFQDAYVLHTDTGAEFGQALDAVKAIQEHLGALHDADVLVPRLLEHLARILKDGYGMPPAHAGREQAGANEKPTARAAEPAAPAVSAPLDLDGRPIAGVHRVNYDACQGLLNLCTRTRAERDARYDLLQEAWQAMAQTRQFDRLRALLAPQDTPIVGALLAAPNSNNDAPNDKNAARDDNGDTPGNSDAPAVDNALPDGSDANTEATSAANLNTSAATLNTDATNTPAGELGATSAREGAALNAKKGAALSAPTSAFEEPDADHAANRQSPQVQRAPGEPGHVAAARRRSAAERGHKADTSGAEDRKPARDKPQTEPEADALVRRGGQPDSGTVRGGGSRSKDDRNKRAGGKNVGAKDVGAKNVRPGSHRADASRAPRSARPRPDTHKGA